MITDINKASQTEWLIIFFVLDTYDIAAYLDKLTLDLERTKLRKTTSIYLLKDTVQRINDPKRYNNSELEIYKYQYNRGTKKTELIRNNLFSVDIKDGNAWQQAITQIYTLHKAKFNALVTWSHGAGIAIMNVNPPTNNFSTESQKPAYIEALFISKISTALKHVVAENKFDMIVMCNCYMNTIDCCYNLKDITDYYIAAATFLQPKGFEFITFINQINLRFKVMELLQPKKLVLWFAGKVFLMGKKKTKGAFYRIYMNVLIKHLLMGYEKNNGVEDNNDLNRIEIITASNLAQASEIKNALNQICAYIEAHKQKIYPILLKICDPQSAITATSIWDAIDLFRQLANELNDEDEFEKLRIRFEYVLTEIILVTHLAIGKSPIDQKKVFKLYSLYLPLLLITIENIPKEVSLSEIYKREYWENYGNSSLFIKDICWGKLVKDFYDWQTKVTIA